VKLQIVTLAAKLLMLCPSDRTLGLLTRYVFSLARYDFNFDVRDRGRMLGSLLNGVTTVLHGEDEDSGHEDQGGVVLRREQVKLVLFEGKSEVAEEPIHAEDERAVFGSLEAITGKGMIGNHYLPDWLEEGVESSLRDAEEEAPPVPTSIASAQTSMPRSIASSSRASPVVLTPTGPSPAGSYIRQETGKAPWTDLDSFYADTHEQEDSEEEETEEEDTEEEGEDGEHEEMEESGEEVHASEDDEEEEAEAEEHEQSRVAQ